MSVLKSRHWKILLICFATVLLPLGDALAQRGGRGGGGGGGRASVRQSRSHPPAPRPPGPRPPGNRPPPPPGPPHRPPPPPPRPPAYRPPPPHYHLPPPRYRGPYYPSYWAWRTAVGVTAVIAVGTILATLPKETKTVVVQEKTYYVYEGVYYEKVLDGDKVVYQAVPKPQ